MINLTLEHYHAVSRFWTFVVMHSHFPNTTRLFICKVAFKGLIYENVHTIPLTGSYSLINHGILQQKSFSLIDIIIYAGVFS